MRATKPKPDASSTRSKKPKKKKGIEAPVAVLTHEGKVNCVLSWVIAGENQFNIKEAIAKFFPEESAEALIFGVMDHLKASADFDATIVIGWCFEASRDLYRRMAAIGDYAGALRAIKQIAEIANHVQVKHPDTAEAETSPAEPKAEAIGDGRERGEAGGREEEEPRKV